jgi:prepilin-type N-terminal cleavage/methylation domain-containing protein
MKKQQGFTLVEFIVAMGVTLVALTATTVAFKDTIRANQYVTMHEDMNENLRAGMNLMEQDLIQAGTGIPTGGIIVPATSNGNASNPCNIGAAIGRPAPDPTGPGTPPAAALFFNPFNSCSFTLPAIEPGPDLGPLITSPDASPSGGSDIITVLYADNSLSLDATPINLPALAPNPGCNGTISNSGDFVTFDQTCVDFTKALNSFTPGDLILFNNSRGSALQAVTAVGAQSLSFAAGDPYHLNQRINTDTSGTIACIRTNVNPFPNSPCSNIPCPGVGSCYPPTTATRIWMITYYLDNVTDPTHARLVRRLNFQPGQPVGETLENLQFAYNFKDSTNTPPTGQPGVPTGFSETQIRSVNVYLGARSTTANPSTGKYLRDSLMTQVSFRSMAFVNRYN